MSEDSGSPMSIRRRRELTVAGLEVLLFALTTGVLAYFGETLAWPKFVVTFAVAGFLFMMLILLRVGPVMKYLRALEEKEFDLATRFARLGLLKFYNMQVVEEQNQRNEDTQKVIANASVMHLLANSAASYVDPAIWRHWPAVRERLDHGATLNLLLLDPFSEDKRLRDQINTAGEAVDSKFKFPVFYELYNKYQNVHIRFVDANVYCSLFFTQDEMFYDPYHLGRFQNRIERMFCMRCRPVVTDGKTLSYFGILKRHFDTLWLTSRDFEDYVDHNQDLIAPLIPSNLSLQRRHRKPAIGSG